MKLLFVHQNMPGQYREMLKWLISSGGHEVMFLTQKRDIADIPGVAIARYKTHRQPKEDAYALSKTWESGMGHALGAVKALKEIVEGGFVPDIVIGHVGWGELSFFREILPDTPIIGFFEYYYSVHGGSVGFDPEFPIGPDTPYIMASHNCLPLYNIEQVTLGHSPTFWQRDRFPKSFHDKIYVCHDGIRTDRLVPNPDVEVKLGRLDRPLTRDDEVVTYMARNLEITRGFHKFMRALPRIQKERPNARILIIGGNDVSYGSQAKHPGGLRGQMEQEVGHMLNWDRLHFLGQVPYDDYIKIVQVSRCHVYLTMPFVLSWSLLESMSMQATIVASDVAPVREAMTHGETGLLVDFHDHDALADQVIDVLNRPEDFAHLGPAAREHVIKTYDFFSVCLPEHVRQINALVPPDKALTAPDTALPMP